MRLAILLVVVLLFPAVSVAQTTWYVPDDFATIQGAIDGSSDGDTIIVRSGTYFENITFEGRGITLKSELGPETTVIDGNSHYTVVYIHDIEGSDSVIEGFTIRNAVSGMYVGGGIYCNKASPTIQNNIITDNFSGFAGGIYCEDASPDIIDNVIIQNKAVHSGGGIGCWYNSSPVISHNIISDNEADIGGGIACSENSSATIIGNNISKNFSYWGGGILIEKSSSFIVNNFIHANMSGHQGGAVFSKDASLFVMNNTITQNTALYGGGIYCSNSSATTTNTIFWNNNAQVGTEILLGDVYGPSVMIINHSDLEGGQNSIHIDSGSDLEWESDMIDADPLFADPLNANFHLTSHSPCINRGTNDGAPTDDIDGDPRPFMGTVDMGADEYTGIHTLSAQDFTVSQSAGGMIPYTLDAGPYHRNRWYCIFGTMSGTAPGQPLPGGWVTLPINGDEFTNIVASLLNTPYCVNFLGVLDGTGIGTAYLHLRPGTLPLAWLGSKMHFAYAVDTFDLASNPVEVEITP